jgi:integral membrane sensor domain MASE1
MSNRDTTDVILSVPIWWTTLSRRHKHFELVAGICVFAISYYLAFKLSSDSSGATPSPLWIPNSLLLCALLRSRPRYWWIFLLITVPIRLTDNVLPLHPVWYRVGTMTVSAVQALAGAWTFRLIAPNRTRFGSWREWLALGAVLLIAAAAAFPMAALRHVLGQDYWLAWQLGFIGDALAQLVVTPALLTWLFWKGPPIAPMNRASAIEAAVLLAGLLLTTYLAYWSTSPSLNFVDTRFFLPIPFLYWAALRFGMAGASIAVPLIAFFTLDSILLRHSIGLLQQAVF